MRLLCFALAAAVATAFSPTASLAARRPVVGGAASSASPRAARRAVPSMGMVNIKITVKKNGILEQEVTGMKGPGCYKLTQALNKALGEVIESTPTSEYFEQPLYDINPNSEVGPRRAALARSAVTAERWRDETRHFVTVMPRCPPTGRPHDGPPARRKRQLGVELGHGQRLEFRHVVTPIRRRRTADLGSAPAARRARARTVHTKTVYTRDAPPPRRLGCDRAVWARRCA